MDDSIFDPPWSLFSRVFFSISYFQVIRQCELMCLLIRMYLFSSPYHSVNSVWHSWWNFKLRALLSLLRLLHFQKHTNTANMVADVLAWANRGKLFKNFLLAGNIEMGKILANTLSLERLTSKIFLLCIYFMFFVYFLLT